MKHIIRIALFVILSPAMGYAADTPKHNVHEKTKGVEVLSHELRDLLSQEMQALQEGMMSIIPAYISGDWCEIESIAGKMRNSYILKKNLTESQIKELHTVLPYAFIEKDQRFHYLAGMLEHAAKSEKPELINFYFSEMAESCVSCHTLFATHKFPDLLSKEKNTEHSH